jgi:hypothetical protein
VTTFERCHADLKAVMDAVEIHSPTEYSIFGERRDFSQAPAAPGDAARSPVFEPALEAELYRRLYTRPTGGGASAPNVLAQRDHISALSAANNGRGTWEPGWRINSLDEGGRVRVSRDEVSFWVPPSGLRTRTGEIKEGDFCRVLIGKEMRHLVPGFYFAFGDGAQQDGRDTSDPLVRLYWHLTAGAAAQYMALTTSLFNRAGIPFRTKVLSDPASYVRADAGVLYLERRWFGPARAIVLEIHRAMRAGLRADVPMFTKPLAEGLGLAEDPHNRMSFGQSRCRLAARALWACFVRGVGGDEGRVSLLMDTFREEGLDPLFPYLDKNSTDSYSLTGDLPATPRATDNHPERKAGKRRKPRAQGRRKARH